VLSMTQWAKSPKKQSEGVRFLLIRHSKYSAMLSKIHTYRLLFEGEGLALEVLTHLIPTEFA